MNFKQKAFLITLLSLFASLLFFAYQESWILFMLPHKKQIQNLPTETKPKSATLYFWKYEKWSFENVSYITSQDPAHNIKTIAHLYFQLLDDETIIHNDITVNSVVLHQNQQIAFISFNQSPFNPEDHTQAKLMIIEGLLKTLRKNNITVPSIQFLTNHQPLKDDHLDFTVPWPLQGYI